MKVFLTGATGYIGHQLAIKLANKNYEVNALVRDLESDKIPRHKNITLYKGNICEYESLHDAIVDCDYVFHTAAFTDLKCNKIDDFYETNVVGTNNVLKASFKVEHNCFLLLAVDETIAGASGCSIDKSVHFINHLEANLSISFFNRLLIPFLINNELEFIKMNQISENIESGKIQEDTITFDNVITQLGDLDEKWKIEAGKSWISRYFKKIEKVKLEG